MKVYRRRLRAEVLQQPATDTAAKLDDGESGTASEGDSQQTPEVTFAGALRSLDIIQTYLEGAGCKDYSHLFALSEKVNQANRQRVCLLLA